MDDLQLMLYDMGITELEIRDPRDALMFRERSPEHKWDYADETVFDDDEYSVTVYTRQMSEALEAEERTRKLGEAVITEVDDSEWKDRWKEFFKPTRVGGRFVIVPGWEEYEAEEGDLVIRIDPGMAFGTGTHETTAGCIRLLEKYLREGDRVLDVGSGSGILSIAAALLGSPAVTAVDTDEDAVRITAENAAVNGMAERITSVKSDLVRNVDGKYDIVVANLMADLVEELSGGVREHMNEDGVFISSGILTEQNGKVEAALKENGFDILETVEEGEWCTIAAG